MGTRRRLSAVCGLALLLSGAVTALATAEPAPEARAARRRWALARMDEMANERLRCRERFTKHADVARCEADYTRRFREYNELYLEAARD